MRLHDARCELAWTHLHVDQKMVVDVVGTQPTLLLVALQEVTQQRIAFTHTQLVHRRGDSSVELIVTGKALTPECLESCQASLNL